VRHPKYFDSIDHAVLKEKLARVFPAPDLFDLLCRIIDSYGLLPGKGLPLGNQTSQWFALYYLDGLDRLIKEKLQIKFYTRYMDDSVLIHKDKAHLRACLEAMRAYAQDELGLEFNAKTQIFPQANGVKYLGFHLYLAETGKVVRLVNRTAKTRFKQKLTRAQVDYFAGKIGPADVSLLLSSHLGHLTRGHTYRFRAKTLGNAAFRREAAPSLPLDG
jgi:hypothetical protein